MIHTKAIDKEVMKHPEAIEFCSKNLFKVTCPTECPHFDLCKSFDYLNERGHKVTVYPYDYDEKNWKLH